MRQLSGGTAVITGGASGIGFAMARAFGLAGMKLVIGDIEGGALDRAVSRLKAEGLQVLGARTDVSNYGSVEALAFAAAEAFGKVHLLVNNAGVSITGPIWALTLEDWRWLYGVNLWGVIHGIKAFTPLLLEHGEPAHIVNVASEAAFNGIGEHAPYCSSKAAVVSISQSLRAELLYANSAVGVSVVCPGFVATDIHRSWRNRADADLAWSDREWRDPARVAGTDQFQAQGVSPAEVAEATLAAVRQDRFYVFNSAHAERYLRAQLEPIIVRENPPFWSWGPDLRPSAEAPG